MPACADPRPRDLLFIVDGSNSMDRDLFYKNMLDYTLALYCAFDPSANNQAGMILFREKIEVAIPLGVYKRDKWQQLVNGVRANPDACCSCCTPTAEALQLAQTEFAKNGKNDVQIAFVITDGVPSNNNVGTGNPAWAYVSKAAGFNPAQYNFQIVGQQAQLLKQAGVRVTLVGVPDKTLTPPDIQYFKGVWQSKYANPSSPNSKDQCISRENKLWCFPMNSPPNPIVSQPVNSNAFASANLDVKQLITLTVGSICTIAFTPSPTTPQPTTPRPTTAKPTSRSPSKAPTPAPTTPRLTQVDLMVLLDQSNSMNWHQDACKAVVDTLPPLSGPASPSACWELFTRFAALQARTLAALPTQGLPNGGAIGWAGDFPNGGTGSNPARGIRVSVWGFACRGNQRIPVTKQYASLVTTQKEFEDAMNKARQDTEPDGGTCPGMAIEAAVRQIESTPEDKYPAQAAVLISDGVWYDVPFPQKAISGLRAYSTATFAVGVAVPQGDEKFGLTPAEIKLQRKQLMSFAGNNPANFFSIGKDDLVKLTGKIATDIGQNMLTTLFKNPPKPRYSWCGWRRPQACAEDNFRQGSCVWPDSGMKNWGCRKAPKKANNKPKGL